MPMVGTCPYQIIGSLAEEYSENLSPELAFLSKSSWRFGRRGRIPLPLVGVIFGSESDRAAMAPCLEALQKLGIDHEVSVISAHRTPDRAREYAQSAQQRGIEVIIAGAGMAAHLPGVIASWTTIPVIGVPLASGELRGLDALLAIVQMPSGIPVATVAVGGARNAAYLAAQILGLKYPEVSQAYQRYREGLSQP